MTFTLSHALSQPLPRHGPAVMVPLEFITPQTHPKPRFESAALAQSREPRRNFVFETRRVCIENVRAWSAPPHLDQAGFAWLRAPSSIENLYDDEQIRRIYIPEIEQLIASQLGAEQVQIFDVTRRSDAPQGANNPDGARKPASQLHVDYTQTSGRRRAEDVLGSAVVQNALAAQKSIVQVNAWRPIRGPVKRSPLAFVDASTVAQEALIATEQIFPQRVGEIYHLAFRPNQRFGYIPNMTPEEVVLIKGWDSRNDGRARFTPHSAFGLPFQDQAPARESIEVRTFAILPRTESK